MIKKSLITFLLLIAVPFAIFALTKNVTNGSETTNLQDKALTQSISLDSREDVAVIRPPIEIGPSVTINLQEQQVAIANGQRRNLKTRKANITYLGNQETRQRAKDSFL